MARRMKQKDPKKPGRIKQLRQSYQLTKKADPKLGLILAASFVIGALVFFGISLLLVGGIAFPIIFGLSFGLLVTMIVFGRRAQSSAFRQMEGKPGAAVAALGMLKRGWKTDSAIGFTKQQDVVHRLVGPPGIVLIGEGNINRLRPLLTNERRKHQRVVSEAPIHEVIVGNREGEVPLPKLVKHVRKLGRDVKPAQMTDILARLKAMDSQRSAVPLPKGPVPTSMKGQRGNVRGR